MVSRSVVAVVVLLMLGTSVAPAAETAKSSVGTIQIGTPLDVARDVAQAAKLRQTGPKAFARTDPDEDWLFYTVVSGRVDLVLTYSIKKQTVTAITLYFQGRPRYRINQFAMAARSIRFDRDGSYAIHFEPPPPPWKGKAEIPRPEFPPRVPGPRQAPSSEDRPRFPAPWSAPPRTPSDGTSHEAAGGNPEYRPPAAPPPAP